MHKNRLPFLFISLGTFLVFALLYHFHLLNSWQDKLLDRFFITEQPQSSIIIVAVDDESLRTIGQWPWKREVFARTLSHFALAKAVGIDISFSEQSHYGAEDDALLASALHRLSETSTVVLPVQLSDRGAVTNKPLSAFSEYTQSGFVNIPLERDGIARSSISNQDHFSSFASLLALSSTPPHKYRIHYQGAAGIFTTIPLSDVLEGRVPDDLFSGKTVLLGATAPDLHDFVGTPFGAMAGVEVHAHSIQTIRDNSYPTEIPSALALILLLLTTLLASSFTFYIRTLPKLLFSLLALTVLLNSVAFLAFSQNQILPVLYFNLALICSAGLSILLQYVSESEEKKRIRKAFQYYLTPKVIDELLSHPEKLALGGEKRKMTILFSDIADFTSISEQLTPIELTTLMNEYLTAMTDIITESGGVVDKYIGDAIMAFWGAPLEDADQAFHACTSAHMMLEALEKLNTVWTSRGITPIHARIGIATGDVVVGNMGSLTRFNYTVMGDSVNLASRLESLNKVYGTRCIVSEGTVRESSALHVREIDVVRVKGKKDARKIFELYSLPLTEEKAKQFEHFTKAYQGYAAGNWQEAITHFTEVLSLGNDGPSSVLLERSVLYRTSPPANWDGVYTFESK